MQKETFQAGDILFYRALPGNLIEQAVAWFERKPNAFVHCAIAISGSQKVEALADGIVTTQIAVAPDGVFHYQQQVSDHTGLAPALDWLKKEGGQAYGFIDLADAILALYERAAFLQTAWYDCSALATEFLIKAGGVDLGMLSEEVHSTTPQELANQLGVK